MKKTKLKRKTTTLKKRKLATKLTPRKSKASYFYGS